MGSCSPIGVLSVFLVMSNSQSASSSHYMQVVALSGQSAAIVPVSTLQTASRALAVAALSRGCMLSLYMFSPAEKLI